MPDTKTPAEPETDERIITWSESPIQEVWREIAEGRSMTLENIHSTLMGSVADESLGELLVREKLASNR